MDEHDGRGTRGLWLSWPRVAPTVLHISSTLKKTASTVCKAGRQGQKGMVVGDVLNVEFKLKQYSTVRMGLITVVDCCSMQYFTT